MQIFPSFASLGKSSRLEALGSELGFLDPSDIDFSNIFHMFMHRNDGTFIQHAPPDRAETSHIALPADQVSAHDAPAASVHQRQLPANREDFARLREKLESLGVDKEVLDRVEDLFDQPGTVTWGQVYDVLREPLKQKANIELTAVQQRDILNLFNKMGFTPQDAKTLLSDLLDNKSDAVWEKVQQMLSTLGNGNNLSMTIKEIVSLLRALGLDLSEIAQNGLKHLDANARAALQKVVNNASKIPPETLTALETVLASAKGEAKPDGEALSAMQKVVEAALKGEIKLDQATLAALKKGLGAAGLDAAKFGQILQQAGDQELTPEQLRSLLATIRDAAAANTQTDKANKGEILSEIHKAMAAAENNDQRMARADRMDSGGTSRLSQSDAFSGMKSNTSNNFGANAGSETTDQNANGNAQRNTADKSAQNWDNFWNKINVKNSADGTAMLRDAGMDARPVVGQSQAANAAEAAAKRVINNVPAPHRTVLQQVHSGLLQNMGQGRQQLTLQLNPPDLGSLTVNLKVVGKEIQAVLRAENQDARQIIAENMPLLRQSLEAQGLRVTRLEVQTQLQDQNQFTQLWQGMDGQKFQEQGAKTQWSALGRGQFKDGIAKADGQGDLDLAEMLHPLGREGGIDLIA
ncbi:MAG TPA: hypothetical protein ENN39_02460 [Desulfonatronum sp.]|nr:hypothetical protein [Desulfonatronum sp.]